MCVQGGDALLLMLRLHENIYDASGGHLRHDECFVSDLMGTMVATEEDKSSHFDHLAYRLFCSRVSVASPRLAVAGN